MHNENNRKPMMGSKKERTPPVKYNSTMAKKQGDLSGRRIPDPLRDEEAIKVFVVLHQHEQASSNGPDALSVGYVREVRGGGVSRLPAVGEMVMAPVTNA
jgi:hypothetical protein